MSCVKSKILFLLVIVIVLCFKVCSVTSWSPSFDKEKIISDVMDSMLTSDDDDDEEDEKVDSNYAGDYQKALNLSLAEWKFNVNLQIFLSKHSFNEKISKDVRCQREIKIYLEEFNMDKAALKKGWTGKLEILENADFQAHKHVPDNPLLLFRMIRRIFTQIPQRIMADCKHIWNVAYIITNAFSPKVPFPTENDLHDAMDGIIRIQYVYGCRAHTQLRFGIIGGIATHVRLNFDDCLALAKSSIKHELFIQAYQWLKSATACLEEATNLPGWDRKKKKSALDTQWDRLMRIHEFFEMEELHEELKHKEEEILHHEYATCRGEVALTAKDQSKLYCYLDWRKHPYFRINPVKVEIIHMDPRIVQFHGFVPDEIADAIEEKITTAEGRLSMMNSYDDPDHSTHHQTLSTWLDERAFDDLGPRLEKVYKKAEFLTGLDIRGDAAEPLRVISFSSLGGNFDFHHDARRGSYRRVATFVMFLANVPLGGFTTFPQLGVFARPLKGSAIFWYSLYEDGSADKRTLHGSCPVVLGTKQSATKWIKYIPNMWKFPCSLEPRKY